MLRRRSQRRKKRRSRGRKRKRRKKIKKDKKKDSKDKKKKAKKEQDYESELPSSPKKKTKVSEKDGPTACDDGPNREKPQDDGPHGEKHKDDKDLFAHLFDTPDSQISNEDDIFPDSNEDDIFAGFEEAVEDPNREKPRDDGPEQADCRWGCSKCRWAKRGCGVCRVWASTGHRGYYVDVDGLIAHPCGSGSI